MKDRSILVTGAAGFLGSVILSHLRKLGARAVGVARSSILSVPPPAVCIDLKDAKSVTLLNANGPYDSVVHCAAVLPGRAADFDLMIANITTTYNILEWALSAGVDHFCFASSCSVYGTQAKSCTEDTLPAPADCYGISKLSCEQMVRALFRKACLLRISAPYGPGLRTETVVKRFLMQAARNQTISLMGSGSREQHFVHEEDVAEAFSMALRNRTTGVFNVSGSYPVSMRDLAESVLRIFDRSGEDAIRCSGLDPQESYRGNFPFEAANKSFGYRPQVSLEVGLRLCARGWGLL